MHRRDLIGSEKVLGPEHPHTLASMHNLAFAVKGLGNMLDALSLIKNCIDLRNKVLGSDHPHAIASSNTLVAWETAVNQPPECQAQQPSSDPPILSPVQTYAGDHITSASNPVGRKRRVLMNLF
ncbi:hypothetical protein BDV12DRAFT_181828 [Aspergillus spectabilis]